MVAFASKAGTIGTKAGKSRAQKDAHNARCRKSRLKKRREHNQIRADYERLREELEVFIKSEGDRIRADNERMSKELEEVRSELPRLENVLQERTRALQERTRALQELKAANVELMRQIPGGWKGDGRNFSSFEEAEAWFVSKTYEQVAKGPDYINATASATIIDAPAIDNKAVNQHTQAAYLRIIMKLKAENERMSMQLKEKENENQKLKRAHQIEGQNLYSWDEWVDSFASQLYELVAQDFNKFASPDYINTTASATVTDGPATAPSAAGSFPVANPDTSDLAT